MFVKKSWRVVNGKKYINYSIAESYRPGKGKNPRHKILANISFLPIEIIKKIAILLKTPTAHLIEDLNSFFKKTYIYGPIVFFYLFMKKLRILRAISCVPIISRMLMVAVILNRILAPRDKLLGSVEWIKNTAFPFLFGIGKKNLIVSQIYKSMDVFYERIDKIMDSFFKENKKGTQFLLYDVTSVFFEGKGPEELAKFGYSRDEKESPQILLTLCLNENEMPIYFDILAGNIQDKKTIIPTIKKLKEKFDMKNSIFVGDRGMISIENLEVLIGEEVDYIVALTHTQARKLLWEKRIKQEELFDKKFPITILMEDDEKVNKKYVLCKSEFRYEQDVKLLNKLLKKERKASEAVKNMVERRYIKDKVRVIRRAERKLAKIQDRNFYDFTYEDKKFEIIENTEYIKMAKNLCGYYILETTNTNLPDEEVEKNYKQLKYVEKAFRELKEIVEIRPIFHWKEGRVRTYIFLCILTQTLVNKTLEILKKSGWLDEEKKHSFEYFLDILSEIKLGVFKINDVEREIITELEETQKDLLKLFDIELKYFKNPLKKLL